MMTSAVSIRYVLLLLTSTVTSSVIHMSQSNNEDNLYKYVNIEGESLFDVQPVKKHFTFASYYGNNMVLQKAPYSATIWGYSPYLGEEITVKMSDTSQSYITTVEKSPDGINGIWKVELEPEDRHGPFVITAMSKRDSISIHSVMFGDVWLCSGQSNMQFAVSQSSNGDELIADAHNYPNARVFTVLQTQSPEPVYDLIKIQEPWSIPSNSTIGGRKWTYFSAVCWLYGKKLYEKLNYPIGMIATDWGGTPVEAWSSREALDKCGLGTNLFKIKSINDPGRDLVMPDSVLWNAMIHPFLHMTIYGAIWYQGEANFDYNKDKYNCTFPSMIDDWRYRFSQVGNTNSLFPFGFVQLAPYRPIATITTGFPDIRWHQTADYGLVPNNRMPNVFMAVAMDLPDFTSPYGSIHPRDKEDVVDRLILSGLAIAYNKTVKEYQGPLPRSVIIRSDAIILIYSTNITVRNLQGFEICCSVGGHKSYSPSTSWWLSTSLISYGNMSVALFSVCAKNEYTLGIRYSWSESPCQFKNCAVYSVQESLPAPPFIWYKPTEQTTPEFDLNWDRPIII